MDVRVERMPKCDCGVPSMVRVSLGEDVVKFVCTIHVTNAISGEEIKRHGGEEDCC
jgi:hypothetical protein